MNESWTELNNTLPLELASRTMAYLVESGTYSCQGFLYNIYGSRVKATRLCNEYPMNKPSTMKFYINATWYGTGTNYTGYNNFMLESGFTESEFN